MYLCIYSALGDCSSDIWIYSKPKAINLYQGLNMAPRHDADDKSNPKSSAID